MTDIKTYVLQQFREMLPNFNWRIGSVIRELLVEPLAYLDDIISTYVSYLKNLNNLDTVLDNPEAHPMEIDSWAKLLNLHIPEAVRSAGTVDIFLNSSEDILIPRGTTFVWGDTSTLFVDTEQKFSQSLGNIQTAYHNCFKISVAVVSSSDVTISLSSGCAISWPDAPDTVTNVCVGNPISGGTGELSYTAKAELIRAHLTNPAVCGSDSIRAGVIRKFAGQIADVAVADIPVAESSGSVPLAIKQAHSPSNYDFAVFVTESNGLSFVEIPAQGVLQITGARTKLGALLDFNVVNRTSQGLDDKIRIEVRSKVSQMKVPQGTALVISCLRLAESAECYSWLNSTQVGSPFKFVYADSAIVDLHLDIPVVSSGSSSVSEHMLSAIQDCINQGRINQHISDSEIVAILKRYRKTVTRNITYFGTVYYKGASRSFSSSGGGLFLEGLCGFINAPVAAYTTLNNIRILQNG